MRILLIEDHEPTGRAIVRALVAAGGSVAWTRHLETATAMAAQAWDVCVLDIWLNGHTSEPLLAHLAESVRIVVISGAEPGSCPVAIQARTAVRLQKPVDMDELARAVGLG